MISCAHCGQATRGRHRAGRHRAHLLPRLIAARALFVAGLIIASLALATTAATADPRAVGRVDTTLAGVPVSAWYPASGTGPAAPYIPAANPINAAVVAAKTAEWLSDPMIATAAGRLSGAVSRAVPRSGTYPVVVFSPGMATPRWLISDLAESVARAGYVFVSIDHVGESPAVDVDGRIVFGSAPDYSPGYMQAASERRNRDMRTVVRELQHLELVGAQLDLGRVATMGHSFGAMIAANEPRTRAVIALDGVLEYDGTPPAKYTAPILLLGTPDAVNHFSWQGKSTRVVFPTAGHYSFTDVAVLHPTPRLCGTLNSEGVAASYVVAFLDRNLRGIPTELPPGPGVRL